MSRKGEEIMFKLKQSLVAFAGLIALVGLIGLVTPLPGRGQGNSGNVPPPSDVNVVNPATSPVLVRDVDRPTAQPYQDTVEITMSFDDTAGTGVLDPVPAGKRLVVEYATARATLTAGQMAVVTLVLGTIRYELPVIPQGTFGTSIFARTLLAGSEPVRLYVNAGETLSVATERTEGDGGASVRVSISGHLVNVP
jgi:hypothetical protein